MDLSLSGLASGFDWKSVVDQLADVERAPQRRLRSQQADLNLKKSAINTLIAELKNLKARAETLSDASLFSAAGVSTSSDSTVATATADSTTPPGTYDFKIYQKATSAVHQGASDVSLAVDAASSATDNWSGFATTIKTGTFTINGKVITIADGDSLNTIINNINSSGSGVTASYDSVTDKITLTSNSTFTVGNSLDTSNFLQATRLSSSNLFYDSGLSQYTVGSSSKLGGLKTSDTLSAARFRTALTDDGNGGGQFKINGVSIDWTTTNTVGTVLQKINDSSAGVTATYDAINDRVVLSNKATGNVGISFEDVTGNFLAAARVTTGTLKNGQDLLYTVNGSALLTSRSNTIPSGGAGISGLSVTTLKAPAEAARVISSTDGAANTLELTSHGYATGTAVKFFTNGALPSNLDATGTFYIRQIDADHVKLFQTASDAFANTNEIDLDNTLSGLNTVVSASPASTSITVGNDMSGIKKSISDFIDQYNKTQSLIETQTASSTDSKGKVTAGILANDPDVANLAQTLRSKAVSDVTGLTGTLKRLESIGYKTGGFSNQISLADSSKLNTSLEEMLSDVKALFTTSSTGIAVRMKAYLDTSIGDNGTLLSHEDSFGKESTRIDKQIEEMEKQVLVNRQRMIDSFIAMEKAQAKVNQQMQFLASRFK